MEESACTIHTLCPFWRVRMSFCACEPVREGGNQEVLGGGGVPAEVAKGLARSQVKQEVLFSEQQTSPGKCYVLTSGATLPGRRATCPHLLRVDGLGSRGSSVITRAELNGQLELSTSSTALAWISRCLHNYETTDNRKGASSLSKGA